ncbi:MAG: hypothetical protein ABIQ00_14315 [Chitinophagaceae bacterium]
MPKSNNPFTETPKHKSSKEIPKTYNVSLYDHLQGGNTINFIQARSMGISQLDSQIAQIRKFTTIYTRDVRINALRYLEYSLHPFIN